MSAVRLFPASKPLQATRAIAVVGLSAWAAKSFLIRDIHAESPSKPAPKIFSGIFGQSLRLEKSEDVNHNTKRISFAFPNSESQSGLTLTSAVLTVSWPQGRWFPVLRPYTPISSIGAYSATPSLHHTLTDPSDQPGSLELLVKKYPNGKASGYLHSLAPGQTLFFLTALKGYQWKPNAFPHVVLVAGGAGITPIYQLARGILENPEDKTCITLVHGINSDADLLLNAEFEDFERRFPGRFKRAVTVSRPVDGSVLRKGYVDESFLKEILGQSARAEEKVFVCGPPAMEKALTEKKGVLERLGYAKGQVVKF